MTTTLLKGLGFAEGLRWHQGRLWFSDFMTRTVQAVNDNGAVEVIAFVPGQPSGLGFMPDGTPLVVSMLDRRLLRIKSSRLQEAANLSFLRTPPCNDLFVDTRGHAYVGTFSAEFWYESSPPWDATSELIHVDPAGRVSVAATELGSPNGIALLADGKTLVVAETNARSLTAFDVRADGTLSNRRIFADLHDIHPDGLCADAHGEVWVAGLYAGVFLRMSEGGRISRRVDVPGRVAVSCTLGGVDGNRLFCAVALDSNGLITGQAQSTIEYVDL